MTTHRSLENSIRDIMAAKNQSTPLEESVEEIVEEQEPETFAVNSADLEEEQLDESVYKGMDAFGRGVVAKSRGGKAGEYISKKAKERSDLNKKNDPGMAKKGYALSVTDRDKAMKKAKKRGLNPKYPRQKFGKPNLPEEMVDEKALTPAEKKKREEVAKAIERDNPKMPMDKKMAIATATAKKVAEGIEDRHADAYDRVKKHLDQVKSPEHKAKFQKKFDTHLKSFDYHYEKDTGQEHHAVDDMHDLANDIKKHNSRVSESSISDRTKRLIERAINRKS